jgi:hypothetical protein
MFLHPRSISLFRPQLVHSSIITPANKHNNPAVGALLAAPRLGGASAAPTLIFIFAAVIIVTGKAKKRRHGLHLPAAALHLSKTGTAPESGEQIDK